jgi:transposase-like protein
MNPTKPRKQYTPEFKAQAIELLALGRPVAELAQELCVSVNLLYSWKSSSQGGSEGGRAVGKNAAADDPRALRREIALLRQENEILKKPQSSSASILGTKTPANYAR